MKTVRVMLMLHVLISLEHMNACVSKVLREMALIATVWICLLVD